MLGLYVNLQELEESELEGRPVLTKLLFDLVGELSMSHGSQAVYRYKKVGMPGDSGFIISVKMASEEVEFDGSGESSAEAELAASLTALEGTTLFENSPAPGNLSKAYVLRLYIYLLSV